MSQSPQSPPIPSTARPAELVRTLSRDGGVAVRTLIGSNLIAEAMSRRELAPTAANALGRALMGAVLIAVEPGDDHRHDIPADANNAGESESVQLQFRGDGPLGTLVAISDSHGRVRGTVERPETNLRLQDGTPDVARALGLGALTVVRHKPGWREPYSGSVPLVSGEIASDITLYLTESEQIPSSMGLGVAMANDESAVTAAGFLVQILPDATDEEISIVESNVRSMPPLTQLALSASDADELIDLLLAGLGSRDRTSSRPIFFCPCTRERALRTLALLDSHEIEEIAGQEGGQEVRCHFCAQAYVFAGGEVRSLLGSPVQAGK